MKFIKFLEELSKNNISEAGLKGSNLAEIYKIGLAVPSAFIITSNAYKYFLEKTQIKVAIFDTLKGLDINDTIQLDRKTQKIRDMIESSEVPWQVRREISLAYKKLSKEFGKNNSWVAVRTSSTIEDLPGAGSVLNIKDEEKIITAIKKCWSSLFTPRSIFYRQTLGFNQKNTSIAVIIQKQLNSEKAGVGFTVEPSSGNKDQIVIEGSWGQSEVITSGIVTPDRYVIDKRTGSIIDKKISKKTKMRILNQEKEGLIDKEVPKTKQDEECLGEYELDELYSLALKLEEHYNSPQNFEWSFENGNLYLLESKPINITYKNEGGEDVDTDKKPFLTGIPTSPGVVSGTVKIINKVSELYKIKKGDILVSTMTSPDYIPTMKRISAIITDEGGKTSHTAVVARELGIPCIVGAKDATSRLKDGEIITIDGDDGFIYIGKFRCNQEFAF